MTQKVCGYCGSAMHECGYIYRWKYPVWLERTLYYLGWSLRNALVRKIKYICLHCGNETS